jgi:predicted RNA-binding protein with PIN domain
MIYVEAMKNINDPDIDNKKFRYKYILSCIYMFTGLSEESKKEALECYEIAVEHKNEFNMFRAKLYLFIAQYSGWKKTVFLDQQSEAPNELLENAKKYGYYNQLAHICVLAFDNKWEEFGNIDELEENLKHFYEGINIAKRLGNESLLVDGYNIIFAWEELKLLAESNIDGARGKLMDILCNYQGYKKNIVILVFDGYKVPGNIGEVSKYHNLYVVYTKEAETADQYIEKTVHDISKKYDVRVATSDAMEQIIIMGQGARRVSANELREEIFLLNAEIKEAYLTKSGKSSTYLFDVLPESIIDFLDDVRMGRREFDEINHSKEESK